MWQRTQRTLGGNLKRKLGRLISRDELFAGLFILGCVNGLGSRVVDSVRSSGWADALLSTFGISVIVLIACVGGIKLILQDKDDKIGPIDLALALALLLLIALPIGQLSWLAVTILGFYVLLFADPPPSQRRGVLILLATTVPMLWSRVLFQYFARPILEIDASLIGWLIGTPNAGNIVPFADLSGNLCDLSWLFLLGKRLACVLGMGDRKPMATPSLVPQGPVLVLSCRGLGGRCQRYANELNGVERSELSNTT